MIGRVRPGCAVAAAVAAGVCVGADRALVVVHDGGGTVDAAPYVELREISDARVAEALVRARAALAGLEPGGIDVFPVRPDPLQPASPTRIRVRGLTAPVFAIGADEASLEWLTAHAGELRERGAPGFVVSCRTEDGFGRIRDFAARLGLSVDPLPGAALAEAFGAVSYPFVAEPSP